MKTAILCTENITGNLTEGKDLVSMAGDDNSTELELRFELLHRHTEALEHLIPRLQYLQLDVPALVEIARDPWTSTNL